MIVYKMRLGFFEQYKVHNEPWPWDENYEEWRAFLKKTMWTLFINIALIFPASITLRQYMFKWEVKFSFEIEDIPDPITLFLQIAFCFVVEDFLFHITHRLSHHRLVYGWMHKKHHEYKTTISIAAEYAHPLDYLFTQLIPSSVGTNILGPRIHVFAVFVWYMVRVSETADGHSGYDFPWSIFRVMPFNTSAAYHDYHHLHNVGNYSSIFRLWDTVFGTNKHFYKHLDDIDKDSQKKKQ